MHTDHFTEVRERLNDEIADVINHPREPMSITTKVITVTPDDARRYLGNMVHNRPLSAANVAAYVREIQAGRWGVTGQGIIFDGKGRLLDGQHRMHAIVKANRSIQTIAVYGVDADMFAFMDTGNKRSGADVINVPNRNRVAAAAKYLFREMSGADWWNNGVRPRPADIIAVVERHPGLVNSASDAYAGGARSLMVGGCLTYCHYRAGLENPLRRDAFVEAFVSGANLGSRSPILALRNALQPTSGTVITDERQISLFILAWNRYQAAGQCVFLRYAKGMRWGTALCG